MKKVLFTALLTVPFLCATLFAEDANKEVRSQGSAPVGQSVGGNPNKNSSGETKGKSSNTQKQTQSTAAKTVAPSKGPSSPAHEVAPAGAQSHMRPVEKPAPRAHYYYGHYYYYNDPYYYATPQTTVIVYESDSGDNTVYYTTETPDTVRLVNEFPVKRSLALQGIFGPYGMISDREGYDFSGYLVGAGLTYQIPINSNSLAFVIGAICTYRSAKQTFDYYEDNKRTGETVKYTFEHLNIDVPLLLRLRGTGSRLSFDFGGKIFFNVHDRLVTKDDSGKEYYHLTDDKDLANFGLTLGFNVDLNSFMAFNIGADFVFGDTYTVSTIRQIPANFTESELTIGLTFKLF